ncbi:unnamed protein product [Phytophthora fragariaefolia]|uniref:Unnamed protein product n=1 Tax=Phytophthora fragariaefolia TaxID=1490495 RepID=A0A9W7CXT7_9STRA|nr:unnamed protein product [Phytophthora fragariaefolia]
MQRAGSEAADSATSKWMKMISSTFLGEGGGSTIFARRAVGGGAGGAAGVSPESLGRWAKLRAESGLDPTPELKIALVGGAAVGKTSIVRRWLQRSYPNAYAPTVGVDVSSLAYRHRGQELLLHVWDVSSAEVDASASSLHALLCEDLDGIFFVFNVHRVSSIAAVDKWRHCLAKYLSPREIPCFLISHKADLLQKRVMTSDDIAAYARVGALASGCVLGAGLTACSDAGRWDDGLLSKIHCYDDADDAECLVQGILETSGNPAPLDVIQTEDALHHFSTSLLRIPTKAITTLPRDENMMPIDDKPSATEEENKKAAATHVAAALRADKRAPTYGGNWILGNNKGVYLRATNSSLLGNDETDDDSESVEEFQFPFSGSRQINEEEDAAAAAENRRREQEEEDLERRREEEKTERDRRNDQEAWHFFAGMFSRNVDFSVVNKQELILEDDIIASGSVTDATTPTAAPTTPSIWRTRTRSGSSSSLGERSNSSNSRQASPSTAPRKARHTPGLQANQEQVKIPPQTRIDELSGEFYDHLAERLSRPPPSPTLLIAPPPPPSRSSARCESPRDRRDGDGARDWPISTLKRQSVAMFDSEVLFFTRLTAPHYTRVSLPNSIATCAIMMREEDAPLLLLGGADALELEQELGQLARAKPPPRARDAHSEGGASSTARSVKAAADRISVAAVVVHLLKGNIGPGAMSLPSGFSKTGVYAGPALFVVVVRAARRGTGVASLLLTAAATAGARVRVQHGAAAALQTPGEPQWPHVVWGRGARDPGPQGETAHRRLPRGHAARHLLRAPVLADWSQLPEFYGTAVYSFEGIGLVLPIQNAMAQPERFSRVLAMCMLSILVLFLFIGEVPTVAFGRIDNGSMTAVLHDYCEGWLVTMVRLQELLFQTTTSADPCTSVSFAQANVALAFACTLSFPIQFYPAIDVLERMLRHKSLMRPAPPTEPAQVVLEARRRRKARKKQQYRSLHGLEGGLDYDREGQIDDHDVVLSASSNKNRPSPLFLQTMRQSFSPIASPATVAAAATMSTFRSSSGCLERLVCNLSPYECNRTLFRSMLCTVLMVIAVCVPDVGLLISLFGSVGSSMLAIVLPPVLYLVASGPALSLPSRAFHWGIVIFGIVGMIAGTMQAVRQVIDSFN